MNRALLSAAFLSASAAFASAGTVTELEGTAYRTPQGAAVPVELAVGAGVEVGDTLEVASGGNLALTLTDQSVIALGEGSRLALDEARFSDQGSTVFSARLLLGSLWAKVTKLAAGSDSKFEIATERGVAGVRGTVFTVDLGEGKDADFEVGVEEGEVEVAHASTPADSDAAGAGPPRAAAMARPAPGLAQAARPPPRFPRLERIAAGNAVVFGPRALARHRFQLRRARMAAFIGKHRDRWLRRALERERERELRREERREQRREDRRR